MTSHAAPADTRTLSLCALRVRRGTFALALPDASATVHAPLILAGANGCGKSTTLRLIAGLDAPDSGTVTFAGELWTDGRRIAVPPHRRGIGMVFQDRALWPGITVAAALEMSCARPTGKRAMPACWHRWVEALGPLRAAPGERLSGGEDRRVQALRAMALADRLLLLDEPAAGLDSATREWLLGALAEFQAACPVPVVAAVHGGPDIAAFGGENATVLILDHSGVGR